MDVGRRGGDDEDALVVRGAVRGLDEEAGPLGAVRWEGGRTRVNVGFTAKGEAKSTVAVSHERLADADEAERMKVFWRERLTALARELPAM